MKKLAYLLSALMLLFITSCSLFEEDENELGGETNLPLNQVGNTFDGSVYKNGEYIDVTHSVVVTKSENGVATLQISADLSKAAALGWVNNLIPAQYKDGQGVVNTNLNFKVTSEGIQDQMNKDSEFHTMVKYDCAVGDTYKLEKSDGKTITRTVTAKSDQDDFSWGWLLIKTITVEQDSRIPGISKIEYRFNHKFGLVYVTIHAEDGSKLTSPIFPMNY